jgi:hypothetical protein
VILYLRSHSGKQDGIDAAQLHIDLETEIGEGLGRGLVHILHLYALRRHAKEGVPHPLHLSVHRRLPCRIPDVKKKLFPEPDPNKQNNQIKNPVFKNYFSTSGSVRKDQSPDPDP